MAGIGNYEGVGGFEMDAPIQYAPFKMKASGHNNSPMLKNFGIGGASPAKFGFGGIMSMLKGGNAKEKIEAMKAKKAGAAQAAASGGVAPHGDEAHTGGSGGGAAIGGPGQGGNMANFNMGAIANKVPMDAGADQELPPELEQAGKLGNLFSDIRLKEKIEKTGISPSGIPIYEFNYIGDSNRYSGAMAQDLLETNPDAVSMDTSGYYRVNYNNIDVDMHLLN